MKVEVKQGQGVSTFLVVLLLIACAFGAWQYGKAKKAAMDVRSLSTTLTAYTDSLSYQKIKLNDTVSVMAAKVRAVYVDKATLADLYAKEVANAKELGLRLKDIQEMKQIATIIRDTVLTPVYVDSLQRLCTQFSDGFVSISTCIPRQGKAEIGYSIKDSIEIVEYYAPHRILWGLIKWSSKTGEYAAFSKNPKASIIGFTVERRIF